MASISVEQLTPIKRALVEIRELRTRLEQTENRYREPIAIIGVGLRFPGGVTDLNSFWKLLSEGEDAISEIPPDRWDCDAYFDPDPDRPGKMNVRHGGFVEGVDQFDAEFFGISPREAASMDPQHRMLLEVCWEALEHAGESPAALAGTQTGVFIGIANTDYLRLLLADQERIDAYSTSGNACSIATGRISYLLGVHGPSIAIDTACSSSLVAVHLACQSLRLGESSVALAGGANLILAPELNINFSKARMLAPDGRCKTFDAAADGYSRGEGCAAIVLKPLSAALADRNPILAVIRGSAINQDGRSAGITAPNGPAQEAVIRAALKNAGVSAEDITYVETHGTGTPLGDPIEVQALAAVLAQGRSAQRPLMIGSVKTNLGHLEAAAGMAGLAKAVLALQKSSIPPHLHLREKNFHIDWKHVALSVPTELTPWPADAPRIVGVSSFGISGTNAHVVLEAAPVQEQAKNEVERPLHVLALSARNGAALREMAARYERFTAETSADVADVCFTANAGRSTFSHRLAVLGKSTVEVRAGLADFLARPQLAAPDSRPTIAFLYPGQGPQNAGMGAELYHTSPTFRTAIDRCEELLRPYVDRKLTEILFPAPGEEALIHDTIYAQPAMFAIGYALTELWRSWGIEPALVAGHSLGEYAAACAAGIFSLSDGLRLVAARGRLTGSLPPGGGMVVVFAPEARVRTAIAPHADRVAIAAINGRANIVVSGALPQLETIIGQLEAEGIKCHRLKISNSFHSPLLEPVLDDFEAVAQTVQHACPKIGFISNMTGTLLDADKPLSGSYWRHHARETVHFSKGLESLYQQGVRHFLELGPKPVLAAVGMDSHVTECKWYASLTPDRSDWAQMLESLQSLYLEGASVNWAGFDRDYVRTRLDAPTYPFQRQRYWAVRPKTPASAAASSVAEAVRAAGTRESCRVPIGIDVPSYAEKWACLEQLTLAHALTTLRTFGVLTAPDVPCSVNSIISCGVPPVYHHLVGRWLTLLTEKGYLWQQNGAFQLAAADIELDVENCRYQAERLLADDPHLLAYVRTCSEKFQRVIQGTEKALETLFPGGSMELAENLYAKANPSRYIGQLAAALMDAAIRAFPPTRPIRVIEIGAGTGGATSALLPVLPPKRTQYLFTDVSEFFFERAMERFASYPFLRFGRLDIDSDFEGQGYAAGSFDFAVAANVLHAARDLGAALERAHKLLAPGGLLVLIETTRHLPWFDMTTGLIEGWQHFQDEYRMDSPLLPPDRWKAVLAKSGFADVMLFPPPADPGEIFANHVIVGCTDSVGVQPADSNSVYDETIRVAPAVAAAAAAQVPDLLTLSEVEREEQMFKLVAERVCKVLHRDLNNLPGKRERLMEVGMDSLMAVQFRNLLQKDLGLQDPIPATLIFDYPTVESIVHMLLGKLPQPTSIPAHSVEVHTRVSEDQVAKMSDEEVEALLEEKLNSRSAVRGRSASEGN